MKATEAIARTLIFARENPDIKPEDELRVMVEMLEPMLEALFGSEYEPYEKNASVQKGDSDET
tara:strand:+ start:1547 stop:1735 length:189 start_codon:yes stop_codon:yes gene_type:complete